MNKNQQKNIWLGIIASFISAILFASKVIFVKLIYLLNEPEITPTKILTWRYLLAMPICIFVQIIFIQQKKNVPLTKLDALPFISIAVLGYIVSSWLDFKGLVYVSASIERIILFSYPALVVLLSVWLFKQPLRRFHIFSILLTFIGIGIAFYQEMNLSLVNKTSLTFGTLLIFFSGLAYAFYLLYAQKYIQRLGAIQHSNYTILFAGGILSFFYCITDGFELLHVPKSVWIYFILLSVFASVLPLYLVSYGMKKIGANNVAIISTIGPVATIFLSCFFLHEPISILQLFGTLVVIIGILLTTNSITKKQIA